MRATADHVVPLVELLKTMSLAVQFLSKRQSCQATKALPAPSTSAVGSGLLRRLPASVWVWSLAMVTTLPQPPPPPVKALR